MNRNGSDKPVREIYLTALEIENPAERRAFLDEACGIDTDRRREVEQFLAVSADGISSPLDDVVNRLAPTDVVEQDETVISVSDTPMIGPYKIREQIGEGGFGVVYVADQTEPVQRRVALKIIKPGMDTKEVIARFQAEKQALAMMDHPHIAKVFDAGTTETGRPYFVMELIRGMPITKFCREKKLELTARLKLFIDVCKAVQHAHQNGIIHRDLKPSNILITLHDGTPVAKVIDFGVAKALSQRLTAHTVYTRHAQMIGTPAYMSPEQAELSGLDIDTRSDVYSLGVLLYELLTGATPFDQEQLLSKGFDEMRRIIREDDPPRPSHRISTLDIEAISTLRQERGLAGRDYSHLLKRELDWIVMKTLEKDRARRYESAKALAADVQRYLDDEPVLACPPSIVYRVKKFSAKHRRSIMTVLLVVGTLSITLAINRSGSFEVPWVFNQEMKSTEWQELLNRPPKLIYEMSELDSIWSHKPGRYITSITSGPQFLELGDAQRSSFRIHLEMRKHNLEGLSGIFFGGEKDDQGRLVFSQAIFLRQYREHEAVLIRRDYTFSEQNNHPIYHDYASSAPGIGTRYSKRMHLEIVVQQNHVTRIKFNDKLIHDLVDENINWIGKPSSPLGTFGLLNERGTVVVRSFQFKPSVGENQK